MPDETTTQTPPADDQGDTTPVVPTDVPGQPDPAGDDADTLQAALDRVAELEAQLAEREAALSQAQDQVEQKDAYIAELEADPYRAPADDRSSDPAGGIVTPQLLAYEELAFVAEQQAWERITGLSYDDTDEFGNPLPDAGVSYVDEQVQAAADEQPTDAQR